MFKIDIDDGIVVKQKKLLEAALSSNPDTERKIRAMVRKVLKDAREEIIRSVHFANGDPRQSVQAIRRITYKQILGGNVNIYNRRKAPTKYIWPTWPNCLSVQQATGSGQPAHRESSTTAP